MKRGFWISDKRQKDKSFICNFFPKNRKGISVMIGYILLISMAILMSIIVYQWVRTYVPQGSIECKEGVSLFIQSYNNDCPPDNRFDLTLKNNGRFDIAGYFIHVTTSDTQELAVTDLSGYNTDTDKIGGGFVNYWAGGPDTNSISAGNTFSDSFDLSAVGQIYSIEIVPLKYETIKNRIRPVSCTDARIQEKLICGTVGISCDGDGVKEGSEQCDGNPPTGDWGSVTGCSDLGSGWTGTLSCTSSCTFDTSGCTAPVGQTYGNGIIEGTEQCDDGNSIDGDGCSSPGTIDSLQIGQYYGFEGGTTGSLQNWVVSGNAILNTANPASKVDNNGVDGGIADVKIAGGISTLSQTFNLADYKTVSITWWGRYNSFESGDCLKLNIGSSTINQWCAGTVTQGSWIPQSVTDLTDSSLLTSSAQLSFVSGMNGATNDEFYVDGINVSGVKY